MLKYFLKQFLKLFLVAFVSLVIIFAFADIMMRISTFPSLLFVPLIFFYMIPFASLFALPLSSAFAVQSFYGTLLELNSYLLLEFFNKIKKSFYISIVIFSIIFSILYGFIIFELAPRSYFKAKKEILEFAKNHITSLEAGRFHQPYSAITLFFKDKKNISGNLIFLNILISIKKGSGNLLFSSQSAMLKDNIMMLNNGTVLTQNKNMNIISKFEEMYINFEDFLLNDTKSNEVDNSLLGALKFLTLEKLLKIIKTNPSANLELHARIVKIIWQLFFPLIALFGSIIINASKYSMIFNISWSGFLLLVSYFLIGILQSLQNIYLATFLMYGLSLLFFIIIFYYGYKKIKR